MLIAFDCKNLALYKGGIAHWSADLLRCLITQDKSAHYILIVPKHESIGVELPKHATIKTAFWPNWLPLAICHALYDYIIFPYNILKLRPDILISPYHDVMNFGVQSSIITIHDLCYISAFHCYPLHLSIYRITSLLLNLFRSDIVITVSGSTRKLIIEHLGISTSRVHVITNTIPSIYFDPFAGSCSSRLINEKQIQILYTAGFEYRKNFSNLLLALRILLDKGQPITLNFTGLPESSRMRVFDELSHLGIPFENLGFLSETDLLLAYKSANVVVCPSLCEGFGRSCLEAMLTNTPLACSDIAIFREIAGDYAEYFDPLDPHSISGAIMLALQRKHKLEDIEDVKSRYSYRILHKQINALMQYSKDISSARNIV